MPGKVVLSERLVKSRAAYLQKSLLEVNAETGLGNGYIYRKWNTDKIMLETVNRIAEALDCKATDLLEEMEVDEQAEAPKEMALAA